MQPQQRPSSSPESVLLSDIEQAAAMCESESDGGDNLMRPSEFVDWLRRYLFAPRTYRAPAGRPGQRR